MHRFPATARPFSGALAASTTLDGPALATSGRVARLHAVAAPTTPLKCRSSRGKSVDPGLGAADQIGVRAILIHALDESARSFYMSFAEFEQSPTDPLHLQLLLKDLRKSLGA